MGRLKLEGALLAGRYLIQRRLAVGSQSEIFLARDESAGQPVVIKARGLESLDRALGAGGLPPPVARFRREGLWLDRLRHPCIVQRVGSGAARDLGGAAFDYHIFEYLAGGNLADLSAAGGGLPLAQALRLLSQAAAALTHCHTLGVVHQDVEPSNLLLAADGQTLKLADFDAAASDEDADGDKEPLDASGAMDCPRIYLPPECQPGQLAPLSVTTDVYALAKTLYAILSGVPPTGFIGRTVAALPPQLADWPKGDALLRVLRQATAMQVTDRYPTVTDFWLDVERAVSPAPLTAALAVVGPDGVDPARLPASADGTDAHSPLGSPAPLAESAAPASMGDLPSPLTTRLIGVGVAVACVALFVGGLTALYRFARDSVREPRRGRPTAAAPARALFQVKVIAPTMVRSAPTESPTRRDWLGELPVGAEADVLEIQGSFYRVRPRKWGRRKDASIAEGWIPRASVDGGL